MLKVIKISHKNYQDLMKNFDYFAGFVKDELNERMLVQTTNIVARAKKYSDENYFITEFGGKKVTSFDDMDLMYRDIWELKMQGYRCEVSEVEH